MQWLQVLFFGTKKKKEKDETTIWASEVNTTRGFFVDILQTSILQRLI